MKLRRLNPFKTKLRISSKKNHRKLSFFLLIQKVLCSWATIREPTAYIKKMDKDKIAGSKIRRKPKLMFSKFEKQISKTKNKYLIHIIKSICNTADRKNETIRQTMKPKQIREQRNSWEAVRNCFLKCIFIF